MPLYVGGDVTDVDAFAALAGRGVDMSRRQADDSGVAGAPQSSGLRS
jgi:hypothetical protein